MYSLNSDVNPLNSVEFHPLQISPLLLNSINSQASRGVCYIMDQVFKADICISAKR